MEEQAAGRTTVSTDLAGSPRKTSNPIGIQSQWSFGWQGNSKDVYNRPNNSKGKFRQSQDSISTTIRVASLSESKGQGIELSKPSKTLIKLKKNLRWGRSQCGTTIPNLLGRLPWSWVLRRLTIARRTRCIRSVLQLL